jgi:signal transduction histidine kinase
VAAVTGSDLLPQVRKTRRRLSIYVTIILLVFLALQAIITSWGITFFVGKEVDLALQGPEVNLSEELQTQIMLVLIVTTAITWIFLSFLSWLVLYKNLKPVSQSIKDRDQFINNARHELRTPLTVLSSEVELFQTHSLSEQAKLDLTGISQQITRLKNLTQSLLTTLDGSKSIPSEFNLIANIKRIEAELMHIYEEKHIFLDVVEQEVNTIRTNEVLFNQLLFNVLENAYKHGKPGTNIEISITKNPTTIAIQNTTNSEAQPNPNSVGVQASKAIATTLGIDIKRSMHHAKYIVTLVID